MTDHINVAVWEARRHCCFIVDSATLSTTDTYLDGFYNVQNNKTGPIAVIDNLQGKIHHDKNVTLTRTSKWLVSNETAQFHEKGGPQINQSGAHSRLHKTQTEINVTDSVL